jgi:hypothetical protein
MSYPLVLHLPNGRAQLVPGSAEAGRPRYEIDGEPVDVDVTIPPDLAARWFWFGSLLSLRVPAGTPGISIGTGSYPPPGVESIRGTCFDAARRIEAESARIAVDLAEARARRAKRTKRPARDVQELLCEIPDRIIAEPEPMLQMELEL